MKVAIIVAYFPPRWLAGTEIATYNTAKYLAKSGHEVHVLTQFDEGLEKESMAQGFHIHRIPAVKGPYVFTLSFIWPVLQTIHRIGPDVVHAQSVSMGLIALMVKKLLRKPYIVYSRGELKDTWAFKPMVARLALRNADAVIALTEDMKRGMAEFYAGDVHIIPNGVDIGCFDILSKQDARAGLDIADDEKVALFVGRLVSQKNVGCLINAMKIIVGRDLRMKLVIIGEGPDGKWLQDLSKRLGLDSHIEFVGRVAHEEVLKYMKAADIFILPSLFEGLPNTVLEAMACGLPVVATKVSGLWEIVTDGENGLLVEPRSPEAMAEAVLKILGDDGLAGKMSANNKLKVRQYSWQATAEKLVEMYKQVAKASQLGRF